MLVIGTAGIESIQDRAKLIVSSLKGNPSGRIAPTKKIRGEKTRIGRNFSYEMRPGHKRLPSSGTPSGVRRHDLAIDENVEVQRHRVKYLQVQLWRTGFLKRPTHRSAFARSRIAHPSCKIIIGFHHQIIATEKN